MSRTIPSDPLQHDISSSNNNSDRDAQPQSNTSGAGRQSPQTLVRDAGNDDGSRFEPLQQPQPPREYTVPIHLTHQPSPAPATVFPYRPSPATPDFFKPPYTPSSTAPGEEDDQSDLELESPQRTVPPEQQQFTGPKKMPDEVVVRGVDSGWRGKLSRGTHIGNVYAREFLAEFLGSFILIIFGNGAVAEVVLSAHHPGGSVNDFFSINIGYGLAVAFGVYIAGGVSGGHLNPAVSLAFAVMGKLKWIKLPIYMLAQYLGCFVASAVLYGIYYDALWEHDHGLRLTSLDQLNPRNNSAIPTAGIFASYPKDYLSWQGGLVDQIFATSFLMIGILALTDDRNTTPHKGVVPILVGLLVTAIGLSYGFNCGYPINPARDLGPRIFTSIAGWGLEPFRFRDHNWFWIPIVGPHLGALLGLGIYQLFIGNNWPPLQRTGIELQVVRKGAAADEYELVKAGHLRGDETTVPLTLLSKDGQRYVR